MNTHQVLRPFEGHALDEAGNKFPYQFKAGELIDASEWRNIDGLIKGRYLKALLPTTIQAEAETPKGNRIQRAAQAAREN